MTNLAGRLKMAAVGLLYYFALKVCYELSIATYYDYYGFGQNLLPTFLQPIFFFAAITPLIWLPTSLSRASDFTSWFLYLFVVGPVCFLAPNLTTSLTDSLQIAGIFAASHGLFEYLRRKPPLPVRRHRRPGGMVKIGLPIFMLVMTVAVLYMVRFEVDLSYGSIYDRRVIARDLLPGRTLADYGVAAFSSAGIPLCLILGYTRKRIHLVLLGVAGIIAMFSVTGEKTTIFTPLLIAAIIYVVERARENLGSTLLLLACGLVSVAIAEVVLMDSYFVAEVFVRRKFAIPALLSVKYWEYFSTYDYLLFKNTLVGTLFFGPEVQSVQGSFLIGEQYFHSATNNAGANIWATGFSHLGYIGIALSSVAAAYVARLFDGLTKDRDLVEVSVVCGLIGSNWAEGGLHTSLLTHGVLAMLGVVYLLPHLSDRGPTSSQCAEGFGRLEWTRGQASQRRQLISMARHTIGNRSK